MGEVFDLSRWESQVAGELGVCIDSKYFCEFLDQIPPGYREATDPIYAAIDAQFLAQIENVTPGDSEERFIGSEKLGIFSAIRSDDVNDPHYLVLDLNPGIKRGVMRLRRYGGSLAELSSLVHIFDSFGLSVVEDLQWSFGSKAEKSIPFHIDDIELRWEHQERFPLGLDGGRDGTRVLEAIESVIAGSSERDLLNRLVLSAELGYHQVNLLRAYRDYRLQISSIYSQSQLDQTLFEYPLLAQSLVGYFESRFDPDHKLDLNQALSLVVNNLEGVSSFDSDQILRGYLELIDSTVRTNYFVEAPRGGKSALALKFAPSASRLNILKHSMLETFVYGATVLGIHLRAGLIARGGIRWSERVEDFRTEIYDLAQAQVKKNSIIIPTGAKGGFVVRNSEQPTMTEIEDAYKIYIAALLSVTDNYLGGEVITPPRVVAYDGDDHYLVVAADKGTATFSDLANEIAVQSGYWLGDAFASGGSHGYDHKSMAITARGAWLAVSRHFAKLDMNSQGEPFKVVGIGDMSGDIFGNGMLQSRSIALVAAFDHRHIFIDPEPNPVGSYNERLRLFKLEKSSWADYNPELISPGGGIWSRNAKEIPLGSKPRSMFGLAAESATPLEVISSILKSQVDLIWFGGIGTFIKARDESNSEVGDSSNDLVRVDAEQVRSRVIVEGANLGITQRGRIRYSRRGGRVNTDFIDNAGGVAMSDYEVNLKILLGLAISESLLEESERDWLLQQLSGEAMLKVLRRVNEGIVAIDRSAYVNVYDLDAFEALIEDWEDQRGFDRQADFLPSVEEFQKRRSADAGLTRPEIAVLQAYAKSGIADSIVDSAFILNPSLTELALEYFPVTVSSRFGQLMSRHPLYPQLISTELAGLIVNRMGIVWAYERSQELNCSLSDIAASFWLSCKVTEALSLWDGIDQIESQLDHQAESTIFRSVVGIIDCLVRDLSGKDRDGSFEHLIETQKSYIEKVIGCPDFVASLALPNSDLSEVLQDQAVGLALSNKLSLLQLAPRAIEAGEISGKSGIEISDVVKLIREIELTVGIDQVFEILSSVEVERRWISWQVRSTADELRQLRRKLCEKIISTYPNTDTDEAISKWKSDNEAGIAKARNFTKEARINPGQELTLVYLVQAELRRML